MGPKQSSDPWDDQSHGAEDGDDPNGKEVAHTE
jgi:hypothetical protein